MLVPGGRSASWSANMSSNSKHLKLPFRSSGRSASWSANMRSNSRNVKLPFLITICHYQRGRSASRYATSSANMRSRHANHYVKLPLYGLLLRGLDLPVDMPLHLPRWALTVEMWNCHSWPLVRGVDLSLHLPIWAANSRNVKLPFFTTICHYQGG